MSPAHVLEPTYANLKLRLMKGAWPIGWRLDAARLADEFGVSVTPVRDCLNRMVGEHLVDFRPQEGYRVAQMTEQVLRDLLGFNLAILNIALEMQRPWDLWTDVWPRTNDHTGRISAIFAAIASMAGNSIIDEAVAGLNDRLHAARSAETSIFSNLELDVAEFTTLLKQGSPRLRHAVAQYHKQRHEAVSQIIMLLAIGPK